MLAQMGMSLTSAWGQFQTASIQADLQEKLQEYRNSMSRLSSAMQTNAVTVNAVRSRDAAVRADFSIQQQAMRDQARAEVEAAAAGVKGNTVDAIAKDLKASAGSASYAQKRMLHQKMQGFNDQKTSIAVAGIADQDVQVIPKPSIGSALLGAGTTLLDIYDSHQPPGSKLLE